MTPRESNDRDMITALTYSHKHESLPEHKEHNGWPLGLGVLYGKSFCLHKIFAIQIAAGVVIKANIYRHFTLHIQALQGAHSLFFCSCICVRNQPKPPCCSYSLAVAEIGTLNVGSQKGILNWICSLHSTFSSFRAHLLSKIKMSWSDIICQKQRRASVSKPAPAGKLNIRFQVIYGGTRGGKVPEFFAQIIV